MPNTRLPGLDLVRLAAALMVMLYHLAWWGPSRAHPVVAGYPAYPELDPIARAGWVGVELFFVLSGLVIARSASGQSASAFCRGRLLRLAPAFGICVLMTFVARLLWSGPSHTLAWDLARSLTLWPTGPWLDGVYWTLIVEIVFYAVVGALLAARRFDRIEPVAAIWALISVAYNVTGLWVEPALAPRLAAFTLLAHGPCFVLGVFLWLWWIRGPSAGRAAVIGLCIVGALAEINRPIGAGDSGDSLTPGLLWLGGVAAIAGSVRWRAGIGRLLASVGPPVRILGLATYPLYLLHSTIGQMIVGWLHLQGLNRWIGLSVAGAAVMGLALFVVLVLERTARALLASLPGMAAPTGAASPG